jgi:phage terminase large subunit-like protein
VSVPSRLVRTESDREAIRQGCYFDESAALRVLAFFRKFLRHSQGKWAGKPFEPLPWQYERVIEPLFGWKRPNGKRRFRRCGIAVAKKNGKSTLLAALGLYLLVGDGEAGAEVYSAGADREQAAIIYNEAARMVKASTGLTGYLTTIPSGKKIAFPLANSYYRALSSEATTKEGLNIHGLLFDELHAQRTPDLFNALKYGGAAREQPLLFWITTAGYDRGTVCYEEWQTALAVQESRRIDVDLLPVIYAASPGDDWNDPAVWLKANPSMGETLDAADFKAAHEEAKGSASKENAFRRYRLNQWVSQSVRWIPMEKWDACLTDYAPPRGDKLYCGLDLSATTDLTAASYLFDKAGDIHIAPRFWVPKDTLRRRERENRTRFDQWVRDGFIRPTEGNVVDYNVIRADLNEDRLKFNFREIAIDPWHATQLAVDLQADGFNVVYVRTGFASVGAATKEFEKRVLGRTFSHDGNPAMSWQVDNVAVEQDASGNLKPSKRRSGEKIDGVVASILALARMISDPKKKSRYEDGGIDFL